MSVATQSEFQAAAYIPAHPSKNSAVRLSCMIDEVFVIQSENERIRTELNLAQAGIQTARDFDTLLQNTPLGKKLLSAIAIQEALEESLIEERTLENIRAAQEADQLKYALMRLGAAYFAAQKAEAASANARHSVEDIEAIKEGANEYVSIEATSTTDAFDFSNNAAYVSAVADYNQTKTEYIETTLYHNYLIKREAAVTDLIKQVNAKLDSHKPLMTSCQALISQMADTRDNKPTPAQLKEKRLTLMQSRNAALTKMHAMQMFDVDTTAEEYAALRIEQLALQNLMFGLTPQSEMDAIHTELKNKNNASELMEYLDSLGKEGFLSKQEIQQYKDMFHHAKPHHIKSIFQDLKYDLGELFQKPVLLDEFGKTLSDQTANDKAYFYQPKGYEATLIGDNVYFLTNTDQVLNDESNQPYLDKDNEPLVITSRMLAQLKAQDKKLEAKEGQVYLIQNDQDLAAMSEQGKLDAAKDAEHLVQQAKQNGHKARQIAEQHLAPGKTLEVAHKALLQAKTHCQQKQLKLQTALDIKQTQLFQKREALKAAHVAKATQDLKPGSRAERAIRKDVTASPIGIAPQPQPKTLQLILEEIAQNLKAGLPLSLGHKRQLVFIQQQMGAGKSNEIIAKELARLEASGNLTPVGYNLGRAEALDNHLGDSYEANLEAAKLYDAETLSDSCAAKMVVDMQREVAQNDLKADDLRSQFVGAPEKPQAKEEYRISPGPRPPGSSSD